MRALDERLLRAARTFAHGPRAERTVACFSRVGEHGAIWLALGAACQTLDRPRAHAWRRGMAAVVLAYGANTAVKLLVGRRRPRLLGLPALTATPTALSFPSSHAATSFAAALAFSRAGLPSAPLYALALALAGSRVYLGVHYPSDVLAGAALGAAVGRALGGARADSWSGARFGGGAPRALAR